MNENQLNRKKERKLKYLFDIRQYFVEIIEIN